MRVKKACLLLFLSLVMSGCMSNSDATIHVEAYQTQVSTPESAAVAITYINSNDTSKQIAGMWRILDFPDSKKEALKYIVDNLHDQEYDVKINAIMVLGEFGSSAREAVPEILSSLESENSTEILIELTIALGAIGDKSAVPYLAKNINSSSEDLAVYSAKSISKLTGVFFPDAQSSGYHVDDNGTPYILVAAKNWWSTEGQYEDWPSP